MLLTLVPGIEVCVFLPQVERGDKDVLVNEGSKVGKYKPCLIPGQQCIRFLLLL